MTTGTEPALQSWEGEPIHPMKPRSFAPEIFLVSLAAIILEISYTRVFSFKLFYYFTYLTIGIALLGIGSGGVLVTLLPRLRAIPSQLLIARACVTAAIVVPLGYLVTAKLQVNALEIAASSAEAGKVVVVCTVLFLPFLLVGIVISSIFSRSPAQIARLYFADLVGAGLGCAACIPLMNTITPPGCVVLAGMLLGIAGLRAAAADSQRLFRAGVAAVLLAAPVLIWPNLLPDPVVDSAKTMSPQRARTGGGWGSNILFSRWSSVFRVDVAKGKEPETLHLINHDGNAGSTIQRFDGDWSKLTRFDTGAQSIPFSVLPKGPTVLIIGAAGGHEILASLYFGAEHVTAIELNPVTVSLLTDHFADYSGNLATNPRVTLINAEGRSYLASDPARYDMIWFVAPDSYAATSAASAGGFVLSESYLYTTEMIKESLAHLRPGGVVCLQAGDIDVLKKPNRSSRYLSTARQAFHELGMDDFQNHVQVASSRGVFTVVTTLLSREPFVPQQIEHFRSVVSAVKSSRGTESRVWYPLQLPDEFSTTHPIYRVIASDPTALEQWKRSYPYDMTPVRDDAPFFWHFTGFGRALIGSTDRADQLYDSEDAKGERVLAVLLLFVIGFSALWSFLPLWLARGVWSQVPHKLRAGTYFAALGLGFMFFEISLIQRFTLFLGYPTYSLTVTLFALLLSSGVGSLVSERYFARRNRALKVLLAALVSLTLVYQFVTPAVVTMFVGSSLPVRVALAVANLAPLGLILGAFMPLGLRTVAQLTTHRDEYVAWGWAINGFCSVVASVAATMLSMTFGFTVVLWIAVAVYAVGITALSGVPMVAAAD